LKRVEFVSSAGEKTNVFSMKVGNKEGLAPLLPLAKKEIHSLTGGQQPLKKVPPLESFIRPLVSVILPIFYWRCKFAMELAPINRTALLPDKKNNYPGNGTTPQRRLDMRSSVSAESDITAMGDRTMIRYTLELIGIRLINFNRPLEGFKRPLKEFLRGATQARGEKYGRSQLTHSSLRKFGALI